MFHPPRRRLRRRRLGLIVACVLALLGGGAAHGQEAPAPPTAPPGFAIERSEWFGKAAPGTTVEVSNPFGDLRARFGGHAGVVEIRAVVQQLASEGPPLAIEAVETSAGVRAVVGFRADPAAPVGGRRLPGQVRRADLVVFVPDGVRFVAATTDGLTEIRGLRGDVEARTTSGDLNVRSVKGNLRLSTESGSMVAVPERLDRTTRQQLATTSGNVDLYLYEDGHFAVDVTTRGLLSTDYTSTVADDPADPARKRATVTVGKGTTPVEVRSAGGHVRLWRKPSADLARRPDPTPAPSPAAASPSPAPDPEPPR